MSDQRLPNLFIVGAPKSGTTALSRYLAGHPDVYMSEQSGIKEPGYFARDADSLFGGRPIHSRESYFKLFEPAPESVRYLGEASVCYLASEMAVREISMVSPRALFVAMVRNPLEISRGMHAQRTKERTENLISFESAWHGQHKRLRGELMPAAIRDPRALQYGELAKIGSQIERLFRAVPKSRIHVIVFDDFSRNPEQSYRDLLNFLGLEYIGRREFPVVNRSRHYHLPELQQSLLRLGYLRKQFGIPGGWGIQRLIDHYNIRSGNAPLKPELQAEMREYFRPEVSILSRLLERDLSHWLD